MKKSILMMGVLVLTLGLSACSHEGKKADKNTSSVTSEMNDSRYQDYSPENYRAVLGKKPFVLFFHADWCATCRRWEKNTLGKIDQLPADAVILKVDYDTETQLKKDFEINKQSMVVFIDHTGQILKTEMDPKFETLVVHFSAPATEEVEVPTEEAEIVEEEVSAEVAEEENGAEPEESELVQEEVVGAVEGGEEGAAATYKDYDATEFEALRGKQKVALYFKADWCPTCRKFDAALSEDISNFPVGTVIFKADYDAETELKKEFEVTHQTTVVVLDASGEVIFKEVNPDMETFKALF
jgi:thiol:disulfide interchange protein